MADSALVKNVLAPWAYGMYSMFNPHQYGGKPGEYIEQAPPDGPGQGPPQFNPQTNTFGSGPNYSQNPLNWQQNQPQGAPPQGMAPQGAPASAQGRPPVGRPPTGGAPPTGSPQMGGMNPYLMEDWMGQYFGTGFNRGFQAPMSDEELYARAASAGRYGNAYGDFDQFMGGAPAGAYNAATRGYGGFSPEGGAIGGAQSNLYSNAVGLAGQRMGDPYMRPGQSVDDLIPMSQWRVESDQYVGDPGAAADDVYGILQQRNAMGLDPNQLAQRGVRETRNLGNQYESDLIRGIDEETKINLATQIPEVNAALSGAGYGESGAGTGAMAAVMRDVMGQGNRDKIRALADFREANMGREAAAIGQRTGVGAEDASGAFGAAAGAYGQGLGAREQALNQIYGSSADILGQAQNNRQNTFNNVYGTTTQALMGSDDAMLRRSLAEGEMNLAGLQGLQGLYGQREGNYDQRLNQALMFGRSGQDYEQQYRDQLQSMLLMPFQTGLQMTTGINTSPAGSGYRVNPWMGAGAQLAGNVAGQMFQPQGQQDPFADQRLYG